MRLETYIKDAYYIILCKKYVKAQKHCKIDMYIQGI